MCVLVVHGSTPNDAGDVMSEWKTWIQRLHRDEGGATATEYIVLLVLVACFIISIVKIFGNTVSDKYTAANEIVLKEVRF